MAHEVAAGAMERDGTERRDGMYEPTATWLRVRPPRTVRGCAHTRVAVGWIVSPTADLLVPPGGNAGTPESLV